ncbi:MAG: hypothetical protein QXD54_03710 [Candidatus Aenigmatarchaeota archaeon]
MKKLTTKQYVSIFFLILLAFFFLSFAEIAVEGPYGGATKSYGWKIQIYDSVYLREYHFFLFYLTIPTLLSISIILVGFDLRLISILILGYSIGSILEDFCWFAFNPYYGIHKFSPEFYTWTIWINVLGLKIPILYFIYSLIILADVFFILKIIPIIEKHKQNKPEMFGF